MGLNWAKANMQAKMRKNGIETVDYEFKRSHWTPDRRKNRSSVGKRKRKHKNRRNKSRHHPCSGGGSSLSPNRLEAIMEACRGYDGPPPWDE
jgi:hypothetical protein